MGGVVALDVGTSALKTVRFDDGGAVGSSRSRAFETFGEGGRREQNATAWCDAAVVGLAEAFVEGPLDAIVLTGTMQNLVPMGVDGVPTGPAILYSDARVDADRRGEMERRLPGDLAERVGNRPDNAWPLFKLMNGEASRAPRWHFGAKDVVIERLTGTRVVDPTVAATTGLMRLSTREWDPELVAATGLEHDALPTIAAGDVVVGETLGGQGIPPGVPVVCGAGDAGASAWGAGTEGPGAAHLYIGTSGWVARTLGSVPMTGPRDTYVLAMPTGDEALEIAPIISAGAALEWAARMAGRTVENAFAAVGERDIVVTAPLFLPYLSGERSPFEDPRVRGAWIGLDAAHGPDELFLAAIEGVAHALRHCAEALGDPPSSVTAIGGGFRHPLMAKIAARAMGVPVTVAPYPLEATAYGAWRLARRALGRPDGAGDRGRQTAFPPDGVAARAAAGRWKAYRTASATLREIGSLPRAR